MPHGANKYGVEKSLSASTAKCRHDEVDLVMVARLLADMPNPALPCRPSRDGSTVFDRVLDAANDAVCYAASRWWELQMTAGCRVG